MCEETTQPAPERREVRACEWTLERDETLYVTLRMHLLDCPAEPAGDEPPTEPRKCSTAEGWGECVLSDGHETYSSGDVGWKPETCHIDRHGRRWGVSPGPDLTRGGSDV